jgi:predicted LPLAT superfamily acyltransferase
MAEVSYQGGIDLKSYQGEYAGHIMVESEFGTIHLCSSLASIRGAATVATDLIPDEARELAGALLKGADAADEARAQELISTEERS